MRATVPLVIGHRGACGYRPEHTLASYELAARLGADFLEPDLVRTRDGVLVARHENEISTTTDVATRSEFADRRTTKTVDGGEVTGWFTEDFTLAELKTLRAVEAMPGLRQRNTVYNGLFAVPTFAEVLELRERLAGELGREIGVYPETKHPTYFRSIGLALEEELVRLLREHGLDEPSAPVFVQSFEAANLRELRLRHGLAARLVLLTTPSGGPFGDRRDYADYVSPAGLAELAGIIDAIGPHKSQVIQHGPEVGPPTSLVADAHAVGLLVHPYTFRAENRFLPVGFRVSEDPAAYGRVLDEQVAYLAAGVDALFTDQPDLTVLARARFLDGAQHGFDGAQHGGGGVDARLRAGAGTTPRS